VTNRLVELTVIPYSTFFILGLSFFLSFVTSLTNRLLTNREQMRAWNKEIAAWRADSLKATRTGDKKLMAKVNKQQKQIMKLQSKMTWQSMKTTFIWTIPIMLLWFVFLIPMYANVQAVAYVPGIGSDWVIPLGYWYLLCSFLAATLLNRLLGLGLGGD